MKLNNFINKLKEVIHPLGYTTRELSIDTIHVYASGCIEIVLRDKNNQALDIYIDEENEEK